MSGNQRIFLGHASEDKPQVRELYDQLKSLGFDPWLDKVDLMPGQNWRTEIPKAIQSAGVFLACLSKQSVAKQSYVQREFRYALSAYAERPSNSIYLIPVRLDECEIQDLRLPILELNLRDFHWVDLFEKDGFERLLQTLKSVLGSTQTIPTISSGDDRLIQMIGSFEALHQASEKAAVGNNPAALRIRDNLADCLDDLRCCGGDLETQATLPSYLAGLAQDIDEHLLGRHFEVMPAAEVLRRLERLTAASGDVGEHRVDTLEYEGLVAELKAAIGQALKELPAGGLQSSVIETANRELRHLRREVGKPSFDAAVVSERRQRLEFLKVNLLERTTLLTEAFLAGGFPNLPLGTVFRDVPEIWCPQLVMIPAGSFMMGSPEEEEGRYDDEGPQHEVTISRGFGLGRYAVTFDEYDHFCEMTGREKPKDGELGVGFSDAFSGAFQKRSRRGRWPVVHVSYEDAVSYCAWLNKESVACLQLPSEAMWEYACRAGTTTPFSFGRTITIDQVNHNTDGSSDYEYREQTVTVGSLPMNPWGLFEMHGNVYEWCVDWIGAYPSEPALGTVSEKTRAMRGGSWLTNAGDVRSACRGGSEPNTRGSYIGFRIACVQSP